MYQAIWNLRRTIKAKHPSWVLISKDCTSKKPTNASEKRGNKVAELDRSWSDASRNMDARLKSSIQWKVGGETEVAHGGQRPVG
jgi:hypothetical protein